MEGARQVHRVTGGAGVGNTEGDCGDTDVRVRGGRGARLWPRGCLGSAGPLGFGHAPASPFLGHVAMSALVLAAFSRLRCPILTFCALCYFVWTVQSGPVQPAALGPPAASGLPSPHVRALRAACSPRAACSLRAACCRRACASWLPAAAGCQKPSGCLRPPPHQQPALPAATGLPRPPGRPLPIPCVFWLTQ